MQLGLEILHGQLATGVLLVAVHLAHEGGLVVRVGQGCAGSAAALLGGGDSGDVMSEEEEGGCEVLQKQEG